LNDSWYAEESVRRIGRDSQNAFSIKTDLRLVFAKETSKSGVAHGLRLRYVEVLDRLGVIEYLVELTRENFPLVGGERQTRESRDVLDRCLGDAWHDA
jgi:hypothetical protein